MKLGKLFLIICILILSSPFLWMSQGLSQADRLSPLVAKVLVPPNPVLGSDGQFHLVYELKVTNVTPLNWTVEKLQILGDGTPSSVIASFQGTALNGRMLAIGTHQPATIIGPNETAIVWINLSFPSRDKIPREISHWFKGKSQKKTLNEVAGITPVGANPAISLFPPLKGERWVAADGCCEAKRHVRALLPINGRLYTAQRFAIDWEKLDQDHRVFVGDPLKVESYFCYGQEVFAVANARVAQAVDGLDNQVPGKLPDDITLKEADGNHIVLDLGQGRYALYAHLKPGSLRVKIGDKVKTGQVLALVGNSGNTSEPHLHFHVMDSSSPLASNGLPYVLKNFELLGRAPSTTAFDQAAAKGTPLNILKPEGPNLHQSELPLDLSLVNFK